MKTKTKTLNRYNYKSTTTVGIYGLIAMLLLMLFTLLTSCSKQQTIQPQQLPQTSSLTGQYRDSSGLGCATTKVEFINNADYITSIDYWSCNDKLYMNVTKPGSLYNVSINDIYEYNSQLDTISATGYYNSDTLILWVTNTAIKSGNPMYSQQPIKHIYIRI